MEFRVQSKNKSFTFLLIFKDLIQVFSVQLNLIFLIVIYNQQNKIDSLIENKYHNEFENNINIYKSST